MDLAGENNVDKVKRVFVDMVDLLRCVRCKCLPENEVLTPFDCDHKYCESCGMRKEDSQCCMCSKDYKGPLTDSFSTDLLHKLMELQEAMGFDPLPKTLAAENPAMSDLDDAEKENTLCDDNIGIEDEDVGPLPVDLMDVQDVDRAESTSSSEFEAMRVIRSRNESKKVLEKSNSDIHHVKKRQEDLLTIKSRSSSPKKTVEQEKKSTRSKRTVKAVSQTKKEKPKKKTTALKKIFGGSSQSDEESCEESAAPSLTPHGLLSPKGKIDRGKRNAFQLDEPKILLTRVDKSGKAGTAKQEILNANGDDKLDARNKSSIRETPPPQLPKQCEESSAEKINKFFKSKERKSDRSVWATPKVYPTARRSRLSISKSPERSVKKGRMEDKSKAEVQKDISIYDIEVDEFKDKKRSTARKEFLGSKATVKSETPVARKRTLSTSSSSSLNTTIGSTRGRLSGGKDKRNAKGETPLHIAARNCHKDKVALLIEEGMDVNAKDNADWTPLHDAICGKNPDLGIIKLLCDAGADVNALGAGDTTPLHDAAKWGLKHIVDYLLSQHASLGIRNSDGKLPRDLATDYEIKELMDAHVTDDASQCEADTSIQLNISFSKAVYYFNYQPSAEMLKKGKQMMGMKISKELTKDVTHMLFDVKPNAAVQLDKNFLLGMALGTWMLSSSWLADSIAVGRFLDPGKYEIKTCNFPEGIPSSTGTHGQIAAHKARENRELKHPGLLDGMNFYLYKSTSWPVLKSRVKPPSNLTMTKRELGQLIAFCNGNVINREPNPDLVDPLESPMRFHAQDDSKFTLTSHVILYDENNVPPIKHNMEHVKSLKIDWLVHSIIHFRLLQPESYVDE